MAAGNALYFEELKVVNNLLKTARFQASVWKKKPLNVPDEPSSSSLFDLLSPYTLERIIDRYEIIFVDKAKMWWLSSRGLVGTFLWEVWTELAGVFTWNSFKRSISGERGILLVPTSCITAWFIRYWCHRRLVPQYYAAELRAMELNPAFLNMFQDKFKLDLQEFSTIEGIIRRNQHYLIFYYILKFVIACPLQVLDSTDCMMNLKFSLFNDLQDVLHWMHALCFGKDPRALEKAAKLLTVSQFTSDQLIASCIYAKRLTQYFYQVQILHRRKQNQILCVSLQN